MVAVGRMSTTALSNDSPELQSSSMKAKKPTRPSIIAHRPQLPIIRQYTVVEYPPCCASISTAETIRWRTSVRRSQYERREEETGLPPLQCGNVATYEIADRWYCKKHAQAIALEMLAVPAEEA